jgi:hypothetical protein
MKLASISLVIFNLLITNSCAMAPKSTYDKKTQTTKYLNIFETPHAFAPYDLTKNGNKVEMLVRVKKRDSYRAQLEFHFDDPRFTDYERKNRRVNGGWGRWFYEIIKLAIVGEKKYSKDELGEILKDRIRVKRLVGVEMNENPNDRTRLCYPQKEHCEKVIYKAVPTPVHLKITQIETNGSEKILFDQIVEHPELNELNRNKCGYFSCDHEIENMIMNPGLYKFEVKSLRDCSEFIGTQIMFGVASTSKGKI